MLAGRSRSSLDCCTGQDDVLLGFMRLLGVLPTRHCGGRQTGDCLCGERKRLTWEFRHSDRWRHDACRLATVRTDILVLKLRCISSSPCSSSFCRVRSHTLFCSLQPGAGEEATLLHARGDVFWARTRRQTAAASSAATLSCFALRERAPAGRRCMLPYYGSVLVNAAAV